MISYFWNSESHLNNAAFAIELLGCVIEVIIATVAIATFPKDWAEKRIERIKKLGEAFAVVTAIIVLVVLISNRRINSLQEARQEKELKQAQSASSQAQIAASNAISASGNATQAEKNAVSIVSNAAKLNMPWRISEKQKADFANFLKTAPKGNVGVWTYMNRPPPNGNIVDDVVAMLNAAGYSTSNSFGIAMWSMPPPPGLLMLVRDTTNAPPFAGIMQLAFGSIGLECPGTLDKSIASNELRIMIGDKP